MLPELPQQPQQQKREAAAGPRKKAGTGAGTAGAEPAVAVAAAIAAPATAPSNGHKASAKDVMAPAPAAEQATAAPAAAEGSDEWSAAAAVAAQLARDKKSGMPSLASAVAAAAAAADGKRKRQAAVSEEPAAAPAAEVSSRRQKAAAAAPDTEVAAKASEAGVKDERASNAVAAAIAVAAKARAAAAEVSDKASVPSLASAVAAAAAAADGKRKRQAAVSEEPAAAPAAEVSSRRQKAAAAAPDTEVAAKASEAGVKDERASNAVAAAIAAAAKERAAAAEVSDKASAAAAIAAQLARNKKSGMPSLASAVAAAAAAADGKRKRQAEVSAAPAAEASSRRQKAAAAAPDTEVAAKASEAGVKDERASNAVAAAIAAAAEERAAAAAALPAAEAVQPDAEVPAPAAALVVEPPAAPVVQPAAAAAAAAHEDTPAAPATAPSSATEASAAAPAAEPTPATSSASAPAFRTPSAPALARAPAPTHAAPAAPARSPAPATQSAPTLQPAASRQAAAFQLLTTLLAAGSGEALQQLYSKHGGSMTSAHHLAVLSRLAQLAAAGEATQEAFGQQVLSAVAPRLAALTPKLLQDTLQAVRAAKLRPSAAWMATYTDALQAHLHSISPTDLLVSSVTVVELAGVLPKALAAAVLDKLQEAAQEAGSPALTAAAAEVAAAVLQPSLTQLVPEQLLQLTRVLRLAPGWRPQPPLAQGMLMAVRMHAAAGAASLGDVAQLLGSCQALGLVFSQRYLQHLLDMCSQQYSSSKAAGLAEMSLVLMELQAGQASEQQLQQLLAATEAKFSTLAGPALLQLASKADASTAAPAALLQPFASAALQAAAAPARVSALSAPAALRLLDLLKQQGQALPEESSEAIVRVLAQLSNSEAGGAALGARTGGLLGLLPLLDHYALKVHPGWVHANGQQLARELAALVAAEEALQRSSSGTSAALRDAVSALLRQQGEEFPPALVVALVEAAALPGCLAGCSPAALSWLARQVQQQQVELPQAALQQLLQQLDSKAAAAGGLQGVEASQLLPLVNLACAGAAPAVAPLGWLAAAAEQLSSSGFAGLQQAALVCVTEQVYLRQQRLAEQQEAAEQQPAAPAGLAAALCNALSAAGAAAVESLSTVQLLAALWAASSGSSSRPLQLAWMPAALARVAEASPELQLPQLQLGLQAALLLNEQQAAASGQVSIFPLAAADASSREQQLMLAGALQSRLDEAGSTEHLAQLMTQLYCLSVLPDDPNFDRLQQQLTAGQHVLSSAAMCSVLYMYGSIRAHGLQEVPDAALALAQRLCTSLGNRAGKLQPAELLRAAWAMAAMNCSPSQKFAQQVWGVLQDGQVMARLDAQSVDAVAWAFSRVEALREEGRLLGVVRQMVALRRPLDATLVQEVAAGLGAVLERQALDAGDRQQLLQGLWACVMAGPAPPAAATTWGTMSSVEEDGPPSSSTSSTGSSGGGKKGKRRRKQKQQQEQQQEALSQAAAAELDPEAAADAAKQVPEQLFTLQMLCQSLDCAPPASALQQLAAAVQRYLSHMPLQSALQLYTFLDSLGQAPSKQQVKALLTQAEVLLEQADPLPPNQLATLLKFCNQAKVQPPDFMLESLMAVAQHSGDQLSGSSAVACLLAVAQAGASPDVSTLSALLGQSVCALQLLELPELLQLGRVVGQAGGVRAAGEQWCEMYVGVLLAQLPGVPVQQLPELAEVLAKLQPKVRGGWVGGWVGVGGGQ
jgi:hypothetical protein